MKVIQYTTSYVRKAAIAFGVVGVLLYVVLGGYLRANPMEGPFAGVVSALAETGDNLITIAIFLVTVLILDRSQERDDV